MRNRRSNAVPALFGVFLLLIGVAWALATPPGAGPDEPAHYVKAMGVGGGDLYGRSPASPSSADVQAFLDTPRSAEELARLSAFLGRKQSAGAIWQRTTSRAFTVPAGLWLGAFGCGYLADDDWGRCLAQGEASRPAVDKVSYVGTYQPYVYFVPGLVMRAAGDPQTAMRMGRLANAALPSACWSSLRLCSGTARVAHSRWWGSWWRSPRRWCSGRASSARAGPSSPPRSASRPACCG